MIDINALKRDILAVCTEDHVGLWQIIRMIERRAPEWDAAKVREYTLGLLSELLSASQIAAGFPSENGREFKAWRSPASAIVAHIKDEWKPGKQATIGEVAWFNTPTHVRRPHDPVRFL